ncbi:MAG: winged helix-turn-helix transcriptional regulator [Chloroflexi bacterium]|nr:winged helix-turn-helix transcriptional regulator [Chloroflexota bacterium]
MDTQVARIRSFDRTVTEVIGALDDRFLGRARPLGEARLLWEIGERGISVRELRQRLGLDAGYVSRLLRALERADLVRVTVDPADARVRRVERTPAGDAECRELDRRSDDMARSLLTPLDATQRDRLVSAMREVERLLVAARTTIERAPVTHPEVRRCFERYAAELDRRFDEGFEPARSSMPDPHELDDPDGRVLLVRVAGDAVGCGALRRLPDGTMEVKRVWLEQRVRGLGLGRRLLDALERHAREMGARVVRLDTNRALVEAIAMYRAAGYEETAPYHHEPYADHWFRKRID